ncbi:ethylene-responsive transcription factor-like protein At4g13040 isoform X1 [Lycium ferocissimum]|uniref:ethylene-responsive transcription factor-like protein At4g13040 isoform X1 n=1 Tax=Lycium ferocissimum TaxID=112874 RepID=UPI002814A3A8|nr:ethylene-responsive transcription factor-like protein At4g13040 isoform X1 [Lycium ferocissimum]XP_059296348.1 ethylene-responsive transcription factor-like protein At4g13040 isoform X1 [Lycium ferocissimum]XP_059296357.1 ethylene-responsive transcription factor-like protein At4g13040 isoform X1 [Lycium ferocissimum]XP_059296360.1 ethylene-responsive transcription factor-like protein At4g13040 isoform X1 [Lycium ferocissimum]
MVSIRRRKLLGLCSGRNAFLVPLPKFSDNGHFADRFFNNKPTSVHPMPATDIDESKEKNAIKVAPGSSNSHASGSLMEQTAQQFPEVKRRKRHRRKHFENQEPCLMRGVYFKNMKWQAAIKVDKKQIHLGTVGTQEEAARLYDRAAFMCGREPNFELSEEEKQELRQFKWDEFLAFTRSAITNKKTRRRSGAGARRKSEPSTSALNSEEDEEDEEGGEPESNGFSASEDIEHNILFS